MAGNREVVDIEEDNYTEEEDDDIEEQLDSVGKDGDDDIEELLDMEGKDDDDGSGNDDGNSEQYEESKGEASGNEQSFETERSYIEEDHEEDEQKNSSLISEGVKDEHAQLLSLPPHGSEVFIGGLPRDAFEEDLRDLCEPFGELYEIRMIKDRDSGESKGYAFVSFKSRDAAEKAAEELQSKEFKGKTIRCSITETKNRLWIGSIPKSLTEDEFRKIIEDVGPGVENIELIKDPQNPSRNRGFAFVLYYNNACADYSLQKMSSSDFKIDGNTPAVTWAEPKSTPDHTAASQVKALYVKNIPENTSTERIKELFQRHGEVTKVVMPPGKAGKRDFGFIHYAERSSALKAVKVTEKYEVDGQVLEVVLAKPQTERKPGGGYPYNAGLQPDHLANPAYGGYTGASYGQMGAAGFGGATPFQSPMIYGQGPMPTGMQMVPMVLPDGRIGYVLQQPGVQLPSHPRRNGGRGGHRGGDDSNNNRRYRPY